MTTYLITEAQRDQVLDALSISDYTDDGEHVAATDLLHSLFIMESAQWQPIESGLPQSGVTVLICYKNSHGNLRRIRAQWIAAKSYESSEYSDFGEYDEASDTYYDPEGWYEQIENAVDYSAMFVSEEVTHWMPLPEAPQPTVKAEGKL